MKTVFWMECHCPLREDCDWYDGSGLCRKVSDDDEGCEK
jgi:hypothetical protein